MRAVHHLPPPSVIGPYISKSSSLLGASYFAVIPPAKIGRLEAFTSEKWDTWFLEARFYALRGTYGCFRHFESDPHKFHWAVIDDGEDDF